MDSCRSANKRRLSIEVLLEIYEILAPNHTKCLQTQTRASLRPRRRLRTRPDSITSKQMMPSSAQEWHAFLSNALNLENCLLVLCRNVLLSVRENSIRCLDDLWNPRLCFEYSGQMCAFLRKATWVRPGIGSRASCAVLVANRGIVGWHPDVVPIWCMNYVTTAVSLTFYCLHTRFKFHIIYWHNDLDTGSQAHFTVQTFHH